MERTLVVSSEALTHYLIAAIADQEILHPSQTLSANIALGTLAYQCVMVIASLSRFLIACKEGHRQHVIAKSRPGMHVFMKGVSLWTQNKIRKRKQRFLN